MKSKTVHEIADRISILMESAPHELVKRYIRRIPTEMKEQVWKMLLDSFNESTWPEHEPHDIATMFGKKLKLTEVK